MFNYATDLSKVEINPEETIEFTVSGIYIIHIHIIVIINNIIVIINNIII